LESVQAETPGVFVTYIEALHRNDCHLFEFALSGKSARVEISTEAIEDEDRTCDLLNRVRRAVHQIR